jgi:transcription antitermination factor NusG
MAILKAEPFIYPEDLLAPVEQVVSDTGDAAQRRWWVLYTRARQEKALSRDLHARQTPFFLPTVSKRTHNGKRTTTSHIPLFLGYVFIHGTPDDRVDALRSNRVSRVIDVPDPDRLVSDLQRLHRLILADAPLTIESRLAVGDQVRVLSGVFEGIEGRVLDRRGRSRLFVAIDFLQQGVSVELDDCILEPI